MLAVDPSSPFTGGAILGDRVRMQDHATDPGVFIRSMATRGHLGGLALATPEAIRLLDALGHRWSSSRRSASARSRSRSPARPTPRSSSSTRAGATACRRARPGLMEVADVFAINKADRAGVDETRRDLAADARARRRHARRRRSPGGRCRSCRRWRRRATASTSCGTPCCAHRAHMTDSGVLEQRRRFRLGEELREIVARRLEARARELCTGERWDELTSAVLARDARPVVAPPTRCWTGPARQRRGRPARRRAGSPARSMTRSGWWRSCHQTSTTSQPRSTELRPPRRASPSAAVGDSDASASDRRARAREHRRRRPGTRRRGARPNRGAARVPRRCRNQPVGRRSSSDSPSMPSSAAGPARPRRRHAAATARSSAVVTPRVSARSQRPVVVRPGRRAARGG